MSRIQDPGFRIQDQLLDFVGQLITKHEFSMQLFKIKFPFSNPSLRGLDVNSCIMLAEKGSTEFYVCMPELIEAWEALSPSFNRLTRIGLKGFYQV